MILLLEKIIYQTNMTKLKVELSIIRKNVPAVLEMNAGRQEFIP